MPKYKVKVKLCPDLTIEADSVDEAKEIAYSRATANPKILYEVLYYDEKQEEYERCLD